MNPSAMTIDEIRKALKDVYGYSDDDIKTYRGKKELSIALRNEINSEKTNDGFFAVIPTDPVKFQSLNENTKTESTEETVEIGSPKWESYILSLLQTNEFEEKDGNKYPKTHGLRRVAQKVLGPIISSGPITVNQSSDTSAMVVYKVEILFPNSMNYNKFIDIPERDMISSHMRTFSAAANVFKGDTPDMFAVHAVATAETKAEGRALKKALCLSTHTAEELANDKNPSEVIKQEYESQNPRIESKIKTNQTKAISMYCERLKIDIDKFARYLYPEKDKFDDSLTQEQGAKMMTTLTRYQVKDSTSLEIPEEIKNASK